SSLSLSKKLNTWIDNQQQISILIGGADGLSSSIKKTADEIWSLSEMTLPHGLVRIIIIEQLYRAWSIISNHPYHRE
ncbi:MAG TPA: 23S rRNA (pseudouridine(1915)-N(3))-methyltransferase RlmH, partial [Gammaproteobacteria bacterium]|nr:23S rRNA (pseudouridine(1915)-N(3))-methyltransferase RlmH [Gammaproteobacteria bacterium]